MIIEYSPKTNRNIVEIIDLDLDIISLKDDYDNLAFIENLERNNTLFVFKGSVSDVYNFEKLLAKYGYKYDHIETIKDGIVYFEAKFCIIKW